MRGNLIKLIVFLGVFFITLRSIYFYSISLAPFPVIGIIMLCILHVVFLREKLDRKDLIFFLAFSFFILMACVPTLFSRDIYINSVVGSFLNLLLLSVMVFRADKVFPSIFVINYILLIHLALFFMQFFAFYFFGEKVDYLFAITGEKQRMTGYQGLSAGGVTLFRPAGIFNEPGTYSVFMITLLWVLSEAGCLVKRIESLVLFTIFLTFSLSGIVFAVAFFFLNYSKNVKLRDVLVLVLLVFGVVFYFGDLFVAYFEYRVLNLGDDKSTNERMLMFTVFSELSLRHQLFGTGIGNDVIDMPLTTLPSVLIYFGVVGSSIFLLLISYSVYLYKVSFKSLFFFGLITFNFYKISNPYVWLFYALLLVVSSQKGRIQYEGR